MRQLLLPGDRSRDGLFVLDEKNSRYLSRVLRMKKGDSFSALDEAGHHFFATVEKISGAAVSIRLSPGGSGAAGLSAAGLSAAGRVDGRDTPLAPLGAGAIAALPPRLALVQALPKGSKMDIILRQAVEAGVEAFFPLWTKHCVPREKGKKESAAKNERRRAIVKEALQQSGSALQTKVFPAADIGTLAETLKNGGFPPESSLLLMFHELSLAETSLHEYCAGEILPTVLLIGPEGGFAQDETDAFLAMGFKPVHFAGPILRSETAALYAVAAVKTILAEKGLWTLSK